MIDDKPDDTTQELMANAARTRRRVATDVERLVTQLAPAQLKDRALDAAEHSLERVALRGLRGLSRTPSKLVAYVAKHPGVGVAIAAGVGVLVWRRRWSSSLAIQRGILDKLLLAVEKAPPPRSDERSKP